MGLFGKGGSVTKFLGSPGFQNAAHGMGAASAYLNGDSAAFARMQAQQQKQQEEMQRQAQIAQVRTSLKAKGYTDDDINLMLTNPEAIGSNFSQRLQPRQFGPEGGSYGLPDATGRLAFQNAPQQTPRPTAEMQNFGAYQGMDPATRRSFLGYQDTVNPRFTQGQHGTEFVPRTALNGGLPPGYDPDRYEVVDGPEPGQQAQQQPMSAGDRLPPGIQPGSPQARIWLEARRRGANFIPRFSPLDGRR